MNLEAYLTKQGIDSSVNNETGRLRGVDPCGRVIVDTRGGLSMTARVQKWGNSLALRLPKALADEFRLEQGSAVELRVVGSKLVLEPHRPPLYRL